MTERQENLSQNTQVDRGQTDITPVPENDERKEAINSDTQEKLEKLKDDIENGIFSPRLLAEHLKIAENIKTNPEKQALYVGSIFGALNKAGFAIQKINRNKISLLRPYIGRGIAKNHGNDIDLYQNILNTSNFDTKVLHKALLYRTSGIENYSEMLKDKASVDGYALHLVKQHPQLERYIKIENGNIVFKHQDEETYTRFKLEMREQIQAHPADADFLVAYFDNIFYNGRLENNFLEDTTFQEYKDTEEKGKKEMMKLLNTNFSSEQLYSLGVKDANGMEHLSRQLRHDPVGTSGQLLRDGIVGGLGAGVLLGILGYFFGGKAGFFGGLALGLVGGAAGGKLGWNAIQDMFLGEKSAKEKPLYQKYKGITENLSEEYQNTLAETLSNERFLSSNAKTTLNIFDTEPNFDKRQKYFKDTLGIDLTTENEVMYKDLFKAILKKQADNHITPQENESMALFLDRKIADSSVNTSAGATTGAAAVGAESSEVKKDEEEVEVSIESLIQKIDTSFTNFKLKIHEIKNNTSVTGGKSEEQKQQEAQDLANKYIELKKYIEQLEATNNLTTEQKNKINEIKLYLAQYYSDKGDVDNRFNKNYFKSIGLALQLLPEENKPTFPGEYELAERLKGNLGISTYITQEVTNGRNIDEVLQDKKITDTITELRGENIKKYEEELEKYLLGIDENNLDENQKHALTLLKDIQGIGWNMKESNLDIATNVGGTLVSVGAGIGTFAAGVAFIPGAGWIAGGVSAVAAGLVTTAGIMISNGDNYFTDWDTGLQELGINTVTFGAAGAIYKGARLIQGGNHAFKSARGWGALGAEATGDVMLGTSIDMMRGYFQGIDTPFTEALKQNLIWGLVPFGLAGAGIGMKQLSPERMKLAEDIVRQAKGANFLRAMGNHTGARKIWENILNTINKMRVYDQETQNLLVPLRSNLDDIRMLKEGDTKVFGDHKVTLKNGTYIFEDSRLTKSWNEFISINKGQNGVEYIVKGEKLTLDIDSNGRIIKIIKENGIEINRKRDVSRYVNLNILSNQGVISKDILDQAIKADIVKPHIREILKGKNIGETLDIGGIQIKKVSHGYEIIGNTTVYGKIDDALRVVDPDKIIDFGKTKLDNILKGRLADINFDLNGKKYFYDTVDNKLKVQEGAVWKEVDPKFIDDNFEILFKQIHGFDIKVGLQNFQNKLKSMTWGDYIKKPWAKMGEWGEVKKPGKFWSPDTLMSEIFAIPKIAKQLGEVEYKKLFGQGGKDLGRIILFGDKNRTLGGAFKRTGVIGGAVAYDYFLGDNDDSILAYMYGGIVTTILIDQVD